MAGLIARELNSGNGAAVAIVCDADVGGMRLAAFQDTLNLVWQSPFVLNASTVHLRLDVDLVKTQAWWSPTGQPGSWAALMAGGRKEGGFTYTTTRLAWELVHAGPVQRSPSLGKPINGSSTLEGGGLSETAPAQASNP
eukprot:1253054-Prymnesium_polylepis.2